MAQRVMDCLSSTLVSLIWTMTEKEDLQLQLLDPCLICLFKIWTSCPLNAALVNDSSQIGYS